jgi:flagellar motor switch protein FliM
LLTDLLTAVTQAFLGALGEPQSLHPMGQLTKGAPIMPCEPTTELCRLVFQVTEGDAEPDAQIQFVLPAHTLAPLVGKIVAASAKMPQEQLTRLLTEHVYNIPVTVTARLAATQISFQDVLDLTADDVLLMDKRIHEPVDLIAADRVLFRGSPARSEARYAVFVTECTADPAPAAATSPAAD